jgi:hypothetical protein
MPATAIPRPWQGKPSRADVEAAASDVAKAYPPPAQLPFKEFWAALKTRVGPKVTRQQALEALDACAKHLKGRPGYSSKSKSPN